MTNHVKGQNSVRLFVTGTPAGTDGEALAAFFAGFGSVEKLVRHRTHRTANAWVLTVDCEETKKRLLHHHRLEFMNRHLQVQEFITGKSLAAKVQDMNERRVLARKVPGIITENAFTQWLESNFGSLETVFSFRTENPLLNQLAASRRTKSYSILFRDREAAKQLIGLGRYTFHPDMEASLFEEFSRKRVVNKKIHGEGQVTTNSSHRTTTRDIRPANESKDEARHNNFEVTNLGHLETSSKYIESVGHGENTVSMHAVRPTSTLYNHCWPRCFASIQSSLRLNLSKAMCRRWTVI